MNEKLITEIFTDIKSLIKESGDIKTDIGIIKTEGKQIQDEIKKINGKLHNLPKNCENDPILKQHLQEHKENKKQCLQELKKNEEFKFKTYHAIIVGIGLITSISIGIVNFFV